MKRERSYIISLYKFLASIFIMLYHFDILYKGSNDIYRHFYIWVESFFIISGLFIGKNAINKKESALNNAKKQIVKLYPMYLVAFFISFTIMSI